MINRYYKIPLNLKRLMSDNSSIQTCSMVESIAQHLMLLITTKKKENRFDFDYGNAVWDIEFENSITAIKWEAIFVASMKNQIRKYEPRIYAPRIDVHIVHVEHTYETKRFSEIKKKAKIAIYAKLTETDENFNFSTELFLSPMSID